MMFCRVYSNPTFRARFVLQIVPLFAICFVPVSARGHVTENAIPLAFRGFSSPFSVDREINYTGVWGVGDTAYLGSVDSGVALIDISNASNTVLLDTYLPDTSFAFDTIQVHDQIGIWASSNGGGLHFVDVSTGSAQALATIGIANGLSDKINSVVLYGDLLFATDANSDRVFAVDVSNVNTPNVLGSFATGDTIANHDLLVKGDHLLIAGLGGRTGGGSTYVYDISDYATNGVVEVGSLESGESTAFLASTGGDMLIVSQKRVGGSIEVWDINDPTDPVFLTRANASDFGLNAFSPGDVFVQDEIAYIAWHQEGVQSLDLDNVRSTNSINRLGKFDTSPNTSPLGGFVGATSVYVFPGHGRVLVSDTRWGLYILDASQTLPVKGDFDGDGKLTVADLDALTEISLAMSHDSGFDLTKDGLVNNDDRERWIVDLFGTTYGDANLDRTFNSSDFIVVFQANEYEDDVEDNSTWSTGDWNGDGDFDSGDFITAFTAGGYVTSASPRSDTQSIPEPQTNVIAIAFCAFAIGNSFKKHTPND
ncbi:MAG: hypothetical protein KDB27_22370 [Planctomycetales bacterium]|nr:hypothetical protein [Planctomycetales bacterium]